MDNHMNTIGQTILRRKAIQDILSDKSMTFEKKVELLKAETDRISAAAGIESVDVEGVIKALIISDTVDLLVNRCSQNNLKPHDMVFIAGKVAAGAAVMNMKPSSKENLLEVVPFAIAVGKQVTIEVMDLLSFEHDYSEAEHAMADAGKVVSGLTG